MRCFWTFGTGAPVLDSAVRRVAGASFGAANGTAGAGAAANEGASRALPDDDSRSWADTGNAPAERPGRYSRRNLRKWRKPGRLP
jgi:hypothetical protein